MTLFAGAGIIAALIGLSAQKAFSNIISGVFIVSFKPFRVGDNILVGIEPSVPANPTAAASSRTSPCATR